MKCFKDKMDRLTIHFTNLVHIYFIKKIINDYKYIII